jgi:hypothetical protein
MAIIYAVTNSFFETSSWHDPNSWQGGVVPGAADDAIISGWRFTLNSSDSVVGTNAGPVAFGLTYWPGYRDINVFREIYTGSGFVPSNGFQFPRSGSIYTYTDRDSVVKIDYKNYNFNGSGLGSTFVSCSVDTSFFKWASGSWPYEEPLPSSYGGFIPTNALMYFSPGVIVVTGSNTVNVKNIRVEFNGKLHFKDSSSLNLGQGVGLYEGELKILDNTTVTWKNTWSASVNIAYTNDGQLNYITQSNANFSIMEIVGPEVRANTTLISSSLIGDYYLTVQNTSSFESGDLIFVGEETPSIPRQDNGQKNNQPFSWNVSSEDETFYVTSKENNRLYVKRFNNIESKILEQVSSTEWAVDEERWQVGDKVVINNQVANIIAVDDYEIVLNDYDFTNPTASLANWETETSRSQYFRGWNLVQGVGLTNYTQESFNQYRHTIEKTTVRDRIKTEAWISNIPTTATPSNFSSFSLNNIDINPLNYFGIFINSDTTLDDFVTTVIPSETQVRGEARTYLGVLPNQGLYFFNPRYESTFGASQSLELATGITTPAAGLFKFGLEYYKGFLKGYINDNIVAEHIVRGGTFTGRSGIFSTNNRLIVTRFRNIAKCQKITLNTNITASVGDWFYETGVEYFHPSGSEVVKLASFITDPLDHDNLAFGYQGLPEYKGNDIYPFIYQSNFTGSTKNNPGLVTPLLLNEINDSLSLGVGNIDRNLTIDLVSPVTVSNAGFIEFFSSTGQRYTQSVRPNSVSGSLDNITWFPITGGVDLRQRHHPSGIRDFNFSPNVYRYVRFTFSGLSNASTVATGTNSNVIRSLYVRNFSSGSNNPRIQVNNASDFNVGDHIVIFPNNQNPRSNNQITSLFPFLQAGSGSAQLLDWYPDHHTIIHKTGSVLVLDRIYNKAPLQKGALVIKVNRSLNISGSFAPNAYRTGRVGSSASGFIRNNRCIIKNVAFQHQNNHLPTNQNTGNQLIPLGFVRDTAYDIMVFQGNSIYNSWNQGNYFFDNYQNNSARNGMLWRKNSFYNIFDGLTSTFGFGHSFGLYPRIFTGNLIHGATSTIGSNQPIYQNASYNIIHGSDFVTSGPGYGANFSINRFGYSQKYISNRNLGIGVGALFNTTNLGYGTVQERVGYAKVANNKVQWGFSTIGTIRNSPDFAFENVLLPDRGGYDFRSQNPSGPASTVGTWNGSIAFAPNTEAIPTGLVKNYNRWGYDFWNNPKGYILKYPNDDWYYYYNFSFYTANTIDPKTAMLSAGVQILSNQTASFTINFDYYNSIDHITQLNLPISHSIDTNLFPQDRSEWRKKGNAAGSLMLFVSKNGNSYLSGSVTYKNSSPQHIPFEVIPKSSSPVRYSKTISLEGEGNYYIYLTQNTYRGYVAIRNLDSILVKPNTDSIFLTHNGFTTKNFNLNDEKTIRKATVITEDTNQKFRLKGAKLY